MEDLHYYKCAIMDGISFHKPVDVGWMINCLKAIALLQKKNEIVLCKKKIDSHKKEISELEEEIKKEIRQLNRAIGKSV